MNLVWAALVVVGITTITVSVMLLVRRGAPEGSYFSDGDRASGVFGVLATGFSVLLGFIIFLAFESYDESRSGAEVEAITLVQQVQTAQFMSEETAEELTGELLCYGRSVVGIEWSALESGTLGETINPWGAEMFRTLKSVDPATAVEQSAYDRWTEQTTAREQARNTRIHGAEGIIPLPLWLVVGVIATVIFVFMLFFADRAERAATQGLLMASVTVVISFSLLLLTFFNNPYGDGFGNLRPVAMERALRLIDVELAVVGLDLRPPCDGHGKAL